MLEGNATILRVKSLPFGSDFCLFYSGKGEFMFYNLLASAYLADTFEPIAKWLTIALLGATVIALTLVFFLKKDCFKKITSKVCIGFFVYALVLGIFLLVLEITKKFDTAYLEENWVSLDVIYYVLLPLLITLCLGLIGGITIFVLSKKQSPALKSVTAIFGVVIAVALVVTLVLIGVHFSSNVSGDGYYTSDEAKLNPVALYVSAGAVILFTVVCAFVLGKNDKKPFDSKCIAFAGICTALSFALSYIKLWDMPTGGSVTLVSLLPVMLFSYVYGTKKGLLVGFLYGLLQAVQDPWLIHPAQFLLDYPVAFAMVCFAGALTDLKVLEKLPALKFALSALIAGAMRFLCHVLSGVFAFGAYAVDAGAKSFWSFSLIYNSYVFIDVALVIVAGFILLSSKAFNKEITRLNPTK